MSTTYVTGKGGRGGTQEKQEEKTQVACHLLLFGETKNVLRMVNDAGAGAINS